MKRLIALCVFLFTFVLSAGFTNADPTPTFNYVSLTSSLRVYDPSRFSLPETHPGYDGQPYVGLCRQKPM